MKEKKQKEKNSIMEETKKKIIKNSIVAALILLSFVGIFVAYSVVQDNMFTRIWQGITMSLLVVSIVIFEFAYKKDSGTLALNGIEILVLACFALTIEYIKIRFNVEIKIYTIVFGVVFLVYYLLKTFIIYTSGRKQVLNSLSDIAEIVKEDKPKKKVAVKRKKGEDLK